MFRSCLILIVACGFAAAKDPCVSGPQVGQRPGPYSFLVASGPERGQPTCYVCETAEKPGVIVFSRDLSAPLAKLLAQCDATVAARPKGELRAWMTVLGEKTVTIDALGQWAKDAGLKSVPTGVFDDPVGPPTYKLAEDAEVTVLLFVDRKVVSNFAFRPGELDDKAVERIADEVGKLGAKK
ncbi:MAG TPA: hypothetical protein VM597_41275 [Gemmataceae bacterium]|jgi:hypothetical protein|nr:hypothetical protein [Gemmataceae bacterium]